MSGSSWGAKHLTALEIAGAAAATAMTLGAASPALAAALGGTAAAGEGAAALGGTAAADAAAAGMGGGTAALFGPTAGGSALAAGSAAIPSLTDASAGAAGMGMGGGTASLFGGQGLLAGTTPQMFTAGLGAGEGGSSMPTFADKLNSGLSNLLPGGNDTLSALKNGMSKIGKAQQAYQAGAGLLGNQQPRGGGAGVPPSQAFGQRASPVNFAQYTAQNNSMMPGGLDMSGPSSGAMGPLGPMAPQLLDPQTLAMLIRLRQGGMYG